MSELTVRHREVSLLEVLDRAINKGVVLWGDITLSVADVDLIYLGLKLLLSSVETAEQMRRRAAEDMPAHEATR
ncbi:MAG: gas vesicle protein [Armatimonadetes bacterium]|nr:gas vesicle protein [Armatimonadota bacterium]